MEEPRTAIARRIFEYWKEVTKHKRSRIDDKRMTVLTKRLADGYSEEDLKLAAFGCSISPFHNGMNDRGGTYNSVELIYKNADQVDKFMELGEKEIERREMHKALKKQEEEARVKNSTTGEIYKEHRAKILSIIKKEAA